MKKLIDDVSIEITPGELLAIMVPIPIINPSRSISEADRRQGPSGAGKWVQVSPLRRSLLWRLQGKSTLLDLMAFRKEPMEGSSVRTISHYFIRTKLTLVS